MHIDLQNLQKKAIVDKKRLIRFIELVLDLAGCRDTELSVLLVDDAYIKRLNRKYLGKNNSTDVLAFPMQGALLGDIVISVETALKESKKRRIPFKNEMERYLVHGILHLTGYDDILAKDKKKMWKKQEEILNSL